MRCTGNGAPRLIWQHQLTWLAPPALTAAAGRWLLAAVTHLGGHVLSANDAGTGARSWAGSEEEDWERCPGREAHTGCCWEAELQGQQKGVRIFKACISF